MGQSTDAQLAYGIPLGDDEYNPKDMMPLFRENSDRFDDVWDFLIWMHFGDELSDEPFFERIKSVPCELQKHCYCDYAMYNLVIRESETTAYRGDVEQFDPEYFDKPYDEWDAIIKDFCEKAGLEFQQPKWLLTSMWG